MPGSMNKNLNLGQSCGKHLII